MKPCASRRKLKAGSQCEVLLAHLSQGKSITTWEAWRLYRITTASQRMSELKDRGHRIDSVMVRRGRSRVALYTLKGRH